MAAGDTTQGRLQDPSTHPSLQHELRSRVASSNRLTVSTSGKISKWSAPVRPINKTWATSPKRLFLPRVKSDSEPSTPLLPLSVLSASTSAKSSPTRLNLCRRDIEEAMLDVAQRSPRRLNLHNVVSSPRQGGVALSPSRTRRRPSRAPIDADVSLNWTQEPPRESQSKNAGTREQSKVDQDMYSPMDVDDAVKEERHESLVPSLSNTAARSRRRERRQQTVQIK